MTESRSTRNSHPAARSSGADSTTGLSLAELKAQNRALSARNKQLAELLKSSRDKLQDLNAQVEALGDPASTYGIYLAPARRGTEAEVFTSGRRMRLNVSPSVEPGTLAPGGLVRLGEGSVVVEACGFSTTGQLATLSERIGHDRAIVADMQGAEQVVHLTQRLQEKARAGDTLLIDAKAGYAFERIPKTEVNQLSLEEIPDVTYDDIGGLHSQIETIRDSVELPFTHPDLYKTYDLKPPKGVLLYGPPGCGKTLIAKAVANSLSTRIGDGGSAHFLNVKGPELLNKYVGETERRIRLIFERARELAGEGRPVIIFFDEMESIFRTRGSGVSSDMETTVVPQLLTEIDGVEDIANVIVIGATNREELIDPAILRPGRLDIKIRIDRPDRAEAREIFARYLTDSVPHEESTEMLIDAAVDKLFAPRPFVKLTLVDGTAETLHYADFVSGAMIANIVDRAKKLAIKAEIDGQGRGVTAEHLRAAVRAEQDESEDMPNVSNPDEWARITGRTGKRVVAAEVL
ncbi:proteasome-associated ATPase [Corynebacterium appendicis CIP 107643]|uniref:AAA ATPase forming ring-shaped complexes n=1 Tax=Corynebacterium appendicis CIP 107643 TaxID=1161099 RepID=A0A1N7IX20_9CORY|nr:proteasome ATPase [Corynebacterium appendicis]WJY61122.1 Proteasome-associated ATPase [Corynebacterium appendicis CIP 107643]SIS41604.1 proteasome-associated ATPase [Corynebacterium appendicis CIP 107643]